MSVPLLGVALAERAEAHRLALETAHEIPDDAEDA